MTWYEYVGAAVGCIALLFYLDHLVGVIQKRSRSK